MLNYMKKHRSITLTIAIVMAIVLTNLITGSFVMAHMAASPPPIAQQPADVVADRLSRLEQRIDRSTSSLQRPDHWAAELASYGQIAFIALGFLAAYIWILRPLFREHTGGSSMPSHPYGME